MTSGAGAVVDLSVPDPKTPAWLNQQKAPLLIGQLKAIAAPFYTRLHAADPAWLEAQRIRIEPMKNDTGGVKSLRVGSQAFS